MLQVLLEIPLPLMKNFSCVTWKLLNLYISLCIISKNNEGRKIPKRKINITYS